MGLCHRWRDTPTASENGTCYLDGCSSTVMPWWACIGTALQLGSALMGTASRAMPGWVQLATLLESLAVGPGLGGTFAQAHSFSIVIWGKLSLLSSNACFPERWGGGDKGHSGGMRHVCFLRMCFFSPPRPPQSANRIQGVSGGLCTDGETEAYGASANFVSE